jgi:hypothetical protein
VPRDLLKIHPGILMSLNCNISSYVLHAHSPRWLLSLWLQLTCNVTARRAKRQVARSALE